MNNLRGIDGSLMYDDTAPKYMFDAENEQGDAVRVTITTRCGLADILVSWIEKALEWGTPVVPSDVTLVGYIRTKFSPNLWWKHQGEKRVIPPSFDGVNYHVLLSGSILKVESLS